MVLVPGTMLSALITLTPPVVKLELLQELFNNFDVVA